MRLRKDASGETSDSPSVTESVQTIQTDGNVNNSQTDVRAIQADIDARVRCVRLTLSVSSIAGIVDLLEDELRPAPLPATVNCYFLGVSSIKYWFVSLFGFNLGFSKISLCVLSFASILSKKTTALAFLALIDLSTK